MAEQKHSMVIRSSDQAEFKVVAHEICEGMWIKRLLEKLKMDKNNPMKVYCDHKATIFITHYLVLHDRKKHIEVDKHFIKEKLDKKVICMPYLSTNDEIADILTKGLHKQQFDKFICKLVMEDIFKPAWGKCRKLGIRYSIISNYLTVKLSFYFISGFNGSTPLF